jgi:hypothetical protein
LSRKRRRSRRVEWNMSAAEREREGKTLRGKWVKVVVAE